jgi:enoyl-[acyl-carrier protein] reductase II
MHNRITSLFGIDYPIVQAGMIWCSGWRLAAAVSNAGGLGLIGAGSMTPEILEEHIKKCKAATDKPFGVNVPLIYQYVERQLEIIAAEGVKIVFSSAGNPAKYTTWLKERGITVVHVVASVKSAVKCEQAGVDAVVAEGFEAGGHNGREETTTFTLVPLVWRSVQIPLIAAGGVATGRGMLAAIVLGADGVQVGSRFAASKESSAHQAFKQKIVAAQEGETMLALKKLIPVRLMRNKFFQRVSESENKGAGIEELQNLLGKGRARLGMFEGNTEEGELEIGQVSALIDRIQPAGEIIKEIMDEFEMGIVNLKSITSI